MEEVMNQTAEPEVSVFSLFTNVIIDKKIYFKLLKYPYDGVIIDLSGDLKVTDDNRLSYQYRIVLIPDGYDVSQLNDPAFQEYMGLILAGIIKRHVELNGEGPIGATLNIALDIPDEASDTGVVELYPTSTEQDPATGATIINYDKMESGN